MNGVGKKVMSLTVLRVLRHLGEHDKRTRKSYLSGGGREEQEVYFGFCELQGTRRENYFARTLTTSSSNSEQLLSGSTMHLWPGWPTLGKTLEHVSQRRKRASNCALGMPSGLSSSDMMETTSVLDASDCILEDDDGATGGLTPDEIAFQDEMRTGLILLFFAEADS